jgi:nucleotide-binding universal stress UspA family protein
MIELGNILVPTDFSGNNQPALQYACELARRFGADLHLLHIVVPSGGLVSLPDLPDNVVLDLQTSSPVARADMRLQNLPSHELGLDLTVHRHTDIGTPPVEIVTYARNHQIDLIVIGTHGHTGWEHLLLGSVAERVVQTSPCPVLTIRRYESPAQHSDATVEKSARQSDVAEKL